MAVYEGGEAVLPTTLYRRDRASCLFVGVPSGRYFTKVDRDVTADFVAVTIGD